MQHQYAELLISFRGTVRKINGRGKLRHLPEQHARAEPAMSGGQRFFLALMLFLNILILGLLALLATGRLEIPLP